MNQSIYLPIRCCWPLPARVLCLVLVVALALAPDGHAQTREQADEQYAASDWQAAAATYQSVVTATPDDAAAWFGLAQSRHQLEQYALAELAYLNALEHGFQPPLRVHYHLARLYMSLEQREKALQQLETIGTIGGVTPQALMSLAELEPLAGNARFEAVLEQLKPCNTDEYRQFDFWLGEWEVQAANAPAPHAHNSITAVQGGCVVLEQYQTQSGYTGMSLNFFDAVLQRWHQTWMDNGGSSVYLEGGLQGNAMVMSDEHLDISKVSGAINRVTWTPLDDGRVRQHWQQTADQGATWTTVFDGYYSRVAGEQ